MAAMSGNYAQPLACVFTGKWKRDANDKLVCVGKPARTRVPKRSISVTSYSAMLTAIRTEYRYPMRLMLSNAFP